RAHVVLGGDEFDVFLLAGQFAFHGLPEFVVKTCDLHVLAEHPCILPGFAVTENGTGPGAATGRSRRRMDGGKRTRLPPALHRSEGSVQVRLRKPLRRSSGTGNTMVELFSL